MINEVIEMLKTYTDGKDNAGKVEISVMQLNRIIKALEQQPTDAVDRVTIKEYLESFEVAHPKMGRWIFDEVLDQHYYCSECKAMGVDYWDYCPNCGCAMKGELE